MDFDGVPDPAVQVRVQRLADGLDLDLDIDAEWERLVARLEDEKRRPIAPRLLLVAAAVLFLVFVARPVVVTGAQAAIRYVVDKVDETILSTIDDVAPQPTVTSTTMRAPEPLDLAPPVPTTTPPVTEPDAHGVVPAGDEYRLTVRAVHEQINDAVGFGRWDPDALQGAPELLESIVDQDPELEDEVRTAIELLRRAIAGPDKDAAIYAHRVIEEIERQRAGRPNG